MNNFPNIVLASQSARRRDILCHLGFEPKIIVSEADENIAEKLTPEMFTEQVLRKCREKGVETNAWTVNDPEMAQKLIDWGIDYLTSNILE